MNVSEVLARLRTMASLRNRDGMARYGINVADAWGIPVSRLRQLAREIGRDHRLALELWDSGVHEARILAALVDEPEHVTIEQMEAWVRQFDSWDVCDVVCNELFRRHPDVWETARRWSSDPGGYVRRAGFALMAILAVHDHDSADRRFETFFPCILAGASDDRPYVTRAVNWALRQIGKRSIGLNRRCIVLAKKVRALGTPGARWIASDALRELASPKVMVWFTDRRRASRVRHIGRWNP